MGLDAKDIYIANHFDDSSKNAQGYCYLNKDGQINLRRFTCALDYSLDQIKLKEIYEKVYRRMDFSFSTGHAEYCTRVIDVTFKYSVGEYNRKGKDCYVRFGANSAYLAYTDSVSITNGVLDGIRLNVPVEHPVQEEILGDYFTFEDGVYKLAKKPKTIMSTDKVREWIYENGFQCGGIHYIRWKRSSGSSRVGKCLFIDEKLYNRMHKWEMCGLKVKDGDPIDLAALEAYISLPSSSIIATLDVPLDSILVVPDYESVFCENVVSVTDENSRLAAHEGVCQIKNSIWDGQGLLDSSLFADYPGKGMLLLRNRFFKCCCFNTNIQDWFKDNGITDMSQIHGTTRAKRVEDIKLITTPSSIKYFKFGTLDQWLDNVDSMFGVVKYDKKTHYFDGELVQTHYQLLNTLQMNRKEVSAFLRDTIHYRELIRDDPAVMRFALKYPEEHEVDDSPAHTKNDIVFKMLGITDRFAQTKMYYDFRHEMLKSFTKNLKLGHVYVHGNYSTLLGNPIEMLQSVIGKFTGESVLGVGNIHSHKFDYDIDILGSRSPHISMSNVWLPHNVASSDIDRYFNMSDEIVAINSIGENTLNRLSGSDFDSDTAMLTDNPYLIAAAKKNKGKFPVAVCDVSAKKTKRLYTNAQKCDLDIKTSNNLIGDIINLSQELNTKIWDKLNSGATMEEVFPIYLDVCKLNIASGLEIDKAKKEFNINNAKELQYIRTAYKTKDADDRDVKPNFFIVKDRKKGYYTPGRKNYLHHKTTMDYLQQVVNSSTRDFSRIKKTDFLPFSALIDASEYDVMGVYNQQAYRVLDIIAMCADRVKAIYADDSLSSDEKIHLSNIENSHCRAYVGDLKFSKNTMIYLLKHMEDNEKQSMSQKVMAMLFGYPNTSFYEVLRQSKTETPTLARDDAGDYSLYGMKFKKVR